MICLRNLRVSAPRLIIICRGVIFGNLINRRHEKALESASQFCQGALGVVQHRFPLCFFPVFEELRVAFQVVLQATQELRKLVSLRANIIVELIICLRINILSPLRRPVVWLV